MLGRQHLWSAGQRKHKRDEHTRGRELRSRYFHRERETLREGDRKRKK